MKFDVVFKANQVEHLPSSFSGRFIERREKTAVVLTASENLNVDIWFKLSMMMDTVELYILILYQ